MARLTSGIKLLSPCFRAAMWIRKCIPALSLDTRAQLGPRPRQEATDLRRTISIPIRPDDRRTVTIGLRYQRRIGNDNPLPIKPDAITPVVGIPIYIFYFDAVGK